MTKGELLKVIRAHCLDCCCGEVGEVKQCGCPTCNLYPYRFGTDPNKRELSPEQLERLAEMRARREKKREKRAGGIDTPPIPSDDVEAREFSIKNSKNEVSDNAERA